MATVSNGKYLDQSSILSGGGGRQPSHRFGVKADNGSAGDGSTRALLGDVAEHVNQKVEKVFTASSMPFNAYCAFIDMLGLAFILLVTSFVVAVSNGNALQIMLAAGISYYAVILTIGGISGAQVNPIVTFVLFVIANIRRKEQEKQPISVKFNHEVSRFIFYLIGQGTAILVCWLALWFVFHGDSHQIQRDMLTPAYQNVFSPLRSVVIMSTVLSLFYTLIVTLAYSPVQAGNVNLGAYLSGSVLSVAFALAILILFHINNGVVDFVSWAVRCLVANDKGTYWGILIGSNLIAAFVTIAAFCISNKLKDLSLKSAENASVKAEKSCKV